ncbi:MAG: cytochrome c oxidase assembly factor Coa1 family protein [Bacteroidota bacterium]
MKKRYLVAVLVVVLLIFLFVVGYIKGITQISEEFETAEPRTYAIELAKSNIELQNAIGQLIEVDTLRENNKRQGQLQLSFGSTGIEFSANAVDLEIPLVGEKGKAKLFVEAEKEEGTWIYDQILVIVESSQDTIHLKQ